MSSKKLLKNTKRPIIGYQFQCNGGDWYSAPEYGRVATRDEAHIYSAETKSYCPEHGWGGTNDGRWHAVYGSAKGICNKSKK